MRLLIGMVLGALLTVGWAYVTDSSASATNERPMVNWDVAAAKFRALSNSFFGGGSTYAH